LSAQRIETDEDFIKIGQQAARARENSERTLQSLNLEDMRRERAEARKDRIGDPAAHLGFSGEEDKEKDNPGLSADERYRQWVKETGEDPYVGEAMTLIGDLIAVTTNPTPGELAPSGEPSMPRAASGSPYSRNKQP
jgi:carboxyl-terminal processing protease